MDPRVTKDPFVWTDAGQHRRSIVAVPPEYRLMLRRQEQHAQMGSPTERAALAKLMADVYPDQPADTWEVLRSALAQGSQSLDRRFEQSGPLQPERFSLREANQRLEKLLEQRRFV